MKILWFSILFILFLTGCSFINEPIKQTIKTKVIQLPSQNDFSLLEKDFIKVAENIQREYNEYISILTEMKKNTKLYKKHKIPKRLSRKVTFHYEGTVLQLLKKIADETAYKFNYDKYRLYDSKYIVKNFVDTMLIDIIYNISDDLEYNVYIDEQTEEFLLKEE